MSEIQNTSESGVANIEAESRQYGVELIDFTLRPTAPPPRDVRFEITSVAKLPLIEPGFAGEWDDTDVLNPSVIVRSDTFYNYYSGFDGKVWSTGLATSSDGLTWTKYSGNPVISISDDGFDSQYIAANGGTLEIGGNIYHYYQGMASNGQTTIGLAVSLDGIGFQKYQNNPVLLPGTKGSWDDLAVADPSVMAFDGKYYLFYLGQDSVGVQRLGIARSEDGINWQKYAGNPILDVGAVGSFDENGLGEPDVVFVPPYFYMIYTGRSSTEKRDVGLAVSSDGVHWRKLSLSGLIPHDMRESWNNEVICDPSIVVDTIGKLAVFFGGGNRSEPAQNLNGKIGVMYVEVGKLN